MNNQVDKEKYKYQVYALDIWTGEEEGEFIKNNFFNIGELEFTDYPDTDKIKTLLIDKDILLSNADIEIVDNYNDYIEIVDRSTRYPILDLQRI